MITKTLDLNNIEQKIFWALMLCICAVSGLYLFSVVSLTMAGVDRDHLSRTAHSLATKASDLESEYLMQSNSITMAYVQELGFHEVNAKFANTASPISKLSIAR